MSSRQFFWRSNRHNERQRACGPCLCLPFNRPDESITHFGQSFNETGMFSRVLECLPEFLHGSVDSMLKVNKRVFRPECRTKMIAGNDLAFGLQQQPQYLQWLSLNRYSYPRSQ